MVPVVKFLTHDEIRARREELLAASPVGVDELRRRAAAYMLTPEEQARLRELDDLTFLETGE